MGRPILAPRFTEPRGGMLRQGYTPCHRRTPPTRRFTSTGWPVSLNSKQGAGFSQGIQRGGCGATLSPHIVQPRVLAQVLPIKAPNPQGPFGRYPYLVQRAQKAGTGRGGAFPRARGGGRGGEAPTPPPPGPRGLSPGPPRPPTPPR